MSSAVPPSAAARERRKGAPLPDRLLDAIHQLDPLHLPAVAMALAARLAETSRTAEPESDLRCLSAQHAADLIGCSPDLVRERESWGIARVLARDAQGKPTRVVYPRILLDRFLREGEPRYGDDAGVMVTPVKTNGRIER